MKQYNRYQMDFFSKYIRLSGLCMAASLFLLMVYYLGIRNLQDIGVGGALVKLWLPLILGAVYLLLLQMLRWNAPGVYAILGALFCLMMLFGVFSTGNIGRIILGVLGYLVCGAVLILAAGGYLPGRLPATICFAVMAAGRLMFDMASVSGAGWVDTVAALCQIFALIFLPMGMKKGKLKEESI